MGWLDKQSQRRDPLPHTAIHPFPVLKRIQSCRDSRETEPKDVSIALDVLTFPNVVHSNNVSWITMRSGENISDSEESATSGSLTPGGGPRLKHTLHAEKLAFRHGANFRFCASPLRPSLFQMSGYICLCMPGSFSVAHGTWWCHIVLTWRKQCRGCWEEQLTCKEKVCVSLDHPLNGVERIYEQRSRVHSFMLDKFSYLIKYKHYSTHNLECWGP